MSFNHGIRWVVLLVMSAAASMFGAQPAHGDVWSMPSTCGCNDALPSCGWTLPSLQFCLPGSFWQRPTPSYYSSWAKVPVTQYRPQDVNDPLSGVAATSLQPCNTYEWQMRRTPGCPLWHNFVDWWRSNCCLFHSRSPQPAATCGTSNGVVTTPQSAESPYYAPSNNGQLVPIPAGASPATPVPADSRPQLEPPPQRSVLEGSASRLLSPDAELTVLKIDATDTSLEFNPPLVAPNAPLPEMKVADDEATPNGETSLELIPVGLSIATPSVESEIPTDEVWDDTGWKSEQ